MLCFDLSSELRSSIQSQFRAVEATSVDIGPLALYRILLGVVVARYDEAFWKFRNQIRAIEKAYPSGALQIDP